MKMDTKYLLLKDQIATYQAQICILKDLMENAFNILNEETDPDKIKDAGTLLSRTRLRIVEVEKQISTTEEEIKCYN